MIKEQLCEAVHHWHFLYHMKWRLDSVLLCRIVTYRTDSWMASVALVMINYNLFPLTEVLSSIMTDLTPHLSMTDRHVSVTSDPAFEPPLHPTSLLTPCCHNLSHGLYPCLCPRSNVWPPCPGCCSRTRRRTTKQCSLVRRGVLGGPILSR